MRPTSVFGLGLIFCILVFPTGGFTENLGVPRLEGIIAEAEWDRDIVRNRFLAGEFDFLPNMIYVYNLETLNTSGHHILGAADFHVCYLGVNCRDYVPEDAGQPDAGRSLAPLNFTAFRQALAWAGLSLAQKEQFIQNWFGPYRATPAYSIVPDQLGVWHNPNIPIPGNNFTEAWQILQNAGFYIDNNVLYQPNGIPARAQIIIMDIDSAIWMPNWASRCADQWNDFFDYYLNVTNCNFVVHPIDFNSLLNNAFVYRNFDIYYLCWGLNRYPDYLFDFFHSSQDFPWRYNSPGLNDTEFDSYIETIVEGLDPSEKIQASYEVQRKLYETMPYIYLYHRTAWAGIRGSDPESLANFVPMAGVGVDNDWTWNQMHWESQPEGGYVKYWLETFPSNLHPGWKTHWILNRISDSLIAVTPDLRDIPWIALGWELEPFNSSLFNIQGLKATIKMRNDLYWQDGFPVTVEDIKFAWNFMKHFPRFEPFHQYYLWSRIDDLQTITLYLNTSATFTIYDFLDAALLFPKHIYDPDLHPARDPVNDPVWMISWDDWMADHTEVMPVGASFPYTALVGVGSYCLANYDNITETAILPRNSEPHDFFDDAPIEVAIKFLGRTCPASDVEYVAVVLNAGTKNNATGELDSCILESYVVEVDGVVDVVQTVSYALDPFDSVEFNSHTINLPAGWHNFTLLIYEQGNPQPIDVTTQLVLFSIREDVNFDSFVGIDDIVVAAEAFGSSPPPMYASERWNAQADLTGDFYVGIDDIVDIAEDFGTT
ncbi:MAG: hypothetical protein JSV05_07845 [Candidatus Bathyarchaeota archaeon]|nr:MAG: hypothetical protein JSV05_07845 [Candidatus Bathyarchaeota archaeon]